VIWLRVVHILAGIFWVGSTVFLAAFLLPTARAAGSEGGRFVERVMQQRGLGPALGVAMLLTLVTGFVMFGRLSAGFQRAWVLSPHGLALGLGALAAILATLVGVAVNATAGVRLGRLRRRLATQAGAPSPADVAEMAALGTRIERGTAVAAGLLVLAAAAMASARYF